MSLFCLIFVPLINFFINTQNSLNITTNLNKKKGLTKVISIFGLVNFYINIKRIYLYKIRGLFLFAHIFGTTYILGNIWVIYVDGIIKLFILFIGTFFGRQ